MLINNMAMDPSVYDGIHISNIINTTNNIIENHVMLTNYCIKEVKTKFRFANMMPTAVICVGSDKRELQQIRIESELTEKEVVEENIRKTTV